MKFLVSGASGLLGSKVVNLALKKGFTVYSGYLSHMPLEGIPVKIDVSNRENVLEVVSKIKPNVIVHCASLTDVDKCELDKELAKKINVEGTKNIVEAAEKVNSFLVFISTDYVFDGLKGMYKEEDKTNPINFYGYTKLLGEEIVKSSKVDYLIARTSVIFGSKPASGKINFALWLIEKLRNNQKVEVLVDQFVSPTLNTNLAGMIIEACERQLLGIYHLSGATRVSRYEFALKLAETFNLNKDLIIASRMEKMSWIAKRPKDSSLDTSKAKRDLNLKPMDLNTALNYLKEELKVA